MPLRNSMVRFFLVLLVSYLFLPALQAQSPETGEGPPDGGVTAPRAQIADPGAVDAGARQDAEAARERLLKAADQIDMIQNNAEATRVAVEQMKASVAKLEDENTALKLQVASLQKAVDEAEADREKQRQVLLDEVSRLVAEKSTQHPRAVERRGEDAPKHDDSAAAPESLARTEDTTPVHHHHERDEAPHDDAPPLTPPPDPATSGASNSAESATTVDSPTDGGSEVHHEKHHAVGAENADASSADSATTTSTETPHPHKGYLYVVKAHETLSLICAAYRDQGVNVTVAEVRKANGLTPDSTLHVGQKIFIPKPGT